MEVQRVPKNNLRSLEWHWCHQRNMKLFGVTQINSRWRLTLLYCIWAIPHSPSSKTGGLSYFRQLQRFPDIPVSNLEEHQFQHRNSRKAPWMPNHLGKGADSQDSMEEVGQHSTSTSRVPFHHNRYVRGSLSLLPQVEWILRCPDSKECWISMQWFECRLVFHRTR